MFDRTADSRTRSAMAPAARPSPVQENAATAMTTVSSGRLASGQRDAQQQRPEGQGDQRADEAVDDDGQRAAEEQRDPPGRADQQQAEGLRVPLALDRVAHREQARDRRELDRVADQEERVVADAGVAADVGEEQDLEDRRRR